MHWFETELLTRDDNLVGLMVVNRDLIGQAETCDGADRVVLDVDSSESPVYGQQEGSAYNGHFESVCYHPLFLFTESRRTRSWNWRSKTCCFGRRDGPAARRVDEVVERPCRRISEGSNEAGIDTTHPRERRVQVEVGGVEEPEVHRTFSWVERPRLP